MEALHAALEIVKYAPPQEIEKTLFGLTSVVPHLADEILQRVERPLEIQFDGEAKRFFIACDYNRDGDSFRSPWTNRYYPPFPDAQTSPGTLPADHLRNLEVEFNHRLDLYRHAYFRGGVSSAYVWDTTEDIVVVALLIRKEAPRTAGVQFSAWEAFHVGEIKSEKAGVEYRVTTTVNLSLFIENELIGTVDLGTQITRQHRQRRKLSESVPPRHVASVCSMIEDQENVMRRNLEAVYIGKAKEVVCNLRHIDPTPVPPETYTLSKAFSAELEEAARRKSVRGSTMPGRRSALGSRKSSVKATKESAEQQATATISALAFDTTQQHISSTAAES